MTEKDYYLLELDDAVIALENKDVRIKSLEDENAELSYQIKCLKDEIKELKELLKRCYSFIDWCELGVPVAQRPILMKDINQALGEDK